jgi:UDP-glucuronate 4-epimerase
MKNILITGGAGFIGSSLIDYLLVSDENYIIAIDNYDSFYSINLKIRNQKKHFEKTNFEFHELDIRNIEKLKLNRKIDCIIHLAAKAGVRESIKNAKEYFDVNINGTLAMLEYAKDNKIAQFVFASSSSIYGINPNIPWVENETELLPISPYASSKLACENIGYTYSHLYNIRFIALRFFTVYGPKQRPDLAINKFFINILKGRSIEMYGNGETIRDYTYIEDIIFGITKAMHYNDTMYEIINLGNSNAICLKDLVDEISHITGLSVNIINKDEQKGDVPKTYANIQKGMKLLNYNPQIKINEGLKKQYEWIINNQDD